MAGPACLPSRDHLRRAAQMNEFDCGTMAPQLVAILASERRTAHHTAAAMLGQPLTDRLQPWVAVVVVKGLTGGHLGDVGRRVEVVGVGERYPQPLRQRRPDRRFPRS